MANEKRLRRIVHRHTKETEQLESEGLRLLLNTFEGRAFLWWILGEAGVFSNPFAQNALHMAFNCGNMNFGQRILNRLLQDQPGLYIKMMEENAARQAIYAAKLAKETDDDPDLDDTE